MNNNNNSQKNENMQSVKKLLNILGFSDSQAELWLDNVCTDNSDYLASVSPFAYVEYVIDNYAKEKNKRDISLQDGINAMLKDIKNNKVNFKNTSKSVVQSQREEWPAASNISFIPGQTAHDVRVFAGDTEITGIARASLDYDVEMGVPTLILEIVDPSVGAPRK